MRERESSELGRNLNWLDIGRLGGEAAAAAAAAAATRAGWG